MLSAHSAVNNHDGWPDLEATVQIYLKEKSAVHLNSVVEAGSALVRHFALLYSKTGMDEDLVQAGYVGLLKALERFDPGRGVRFSTYASCCITGEIRHELRWRNAFDRPKWVVELQGRIIAATQKLMQEKDELPSLPELAAALNIREAEIREAMRAGRVPFHELELAQLKSLRYESFQLPLEDRILIRQALHSLSELQRKVIYLIYYRDLTQQQVAEKLGINQRSVSRLLHKGLDIINKYISA